MQLDDCKLSIRIDPSLKKNLRIVASQRGDIGLTLTGLINEILVDFIDVCKEKKLIS